MSVKVRVAACTRIFRNARTDGTRRRGAGIFGGTGDFPGITLDLFNWVHGQRCAGGFAKLMAGGERRTVDAPLGAFRKSAHHGRRRRYPGKRRRNGRADIRVGGGRPRRSSLRLQLGLGDQMFITDRGFGSMGLLEQQAV
jgi:hypothetical protein